MLAVNLPKNVENRLFVLSQTIGISQDVLAQNAIHQYLQNLEMIYQQKNHGDNSLKFVNQRTKKHAKSRAGALKNYANPSLIEQEKTAWAMAMIEKHQQTTMDS